MSLVMIDICISWQTYEVLCIIKVYWSVPGRVEEGYGLLHSEETCVLREDRDATKVLTDACVKV